MTSCPLCHKESIFHFHSRDYNRKISKKIFDHYRCPACGLIFIAPIPDNLNDYYPASYYAGPSSHDQLTAAAVHDRYKIDIVRKYVPTGRLLEIGPARGCFTWLSKKAGFEVETIEMDAESCRFQSDIVGVRAINDSDTSRALKDLAPYNVIALWHVIEHLPNPWRAIEAISEKLLPGGIIVIATPNPDAFQFHILGKYWPHVDAPRHVLLIPAPLMMEKMKSLGFTTAMFTTNDAGGLSWNRFGWVYCFSNLCTLRLMKLVAKLLGWLVSILVSPIEKTEGKGCAYTLVFRKEKTK